MPYKQRKRLWGIFQVSWESIGGFHQKDYKIQLIF